MENKERNTVLECEGFVVLPKNTVCDVLLPLEKVLFIFKSLGYQAGCDQSVFYKLQNDKKLDFS